MRWVRDLPYLPDPSDRHPAPHKPHKRINGIYVLTREPGDSEVSWTSPDGSNYALEYFEAENFLMRILKIPEAVSMSVVDRLWNFCFIAFDLNDPEKGITDKDVALQKWPHIGEYDLGR